MATRLYALLIYINVVIILPLSSRSCVEECGMIIIQNTREIVYRLLQIGLYAASMCKEK
jgi:hypothetical protein